MRSLTRSRVGFTLIEVMLSMTLLLFVLGVATRSFQKQSSQLAAQSGRLEAQQTIMFTLGELDRELRLAGTAVSNDQPVIVLADSMALTFNADLMSTVVNDPSPVYIDVDADPLMTTAFRSTNKLYLPNSTTNQYPDTTYLRSPGVPSGAETISFWLSKDSTSSVNNEYILWRRANHGSPRIVSKGIIRNPGDTTFQYFKHDSTGALFPIPKTLLPLWHKAMTHGSKADSGKFAIVDSIKTVRIRLTIVYHDRKGPITRRLDHTIRVMNAGLVRRVTCGEPPQPVTAVTAVASLDTLNSPVVKITFPKSLDQEEAEKDVERYALYKRLVGSAATTNEAFASIPAAGDTTYTFEDTDVQPGQELVYGVSVQDCSPSSSSVVNAAAVVIPTPVEIPEIP